MYTLHSAYALSRELGILWKQVDLRNRTIASIRSEFSDIELQVENTLLPGLRRLKFSDLIRLEPDANTTIPAFFASLGNRAIRTTVETLQLKTGEIKFIDAFQANYHVERINRIYGTRNIHFREDATDAWMSKSGVDYRHFARNCLVAINGFFHIVDADDDGVYVKDAYTTCNKSGRNEIGIINFENVSSFDCLPITDDMISDSGQTAPIGDKMYIKIPEDKKDKLTALVAGGYLYLLDQDSFYRVSDNVFCFEIRNVDFLDRFFASEKVIDMESLGLERNGRNEMQLSRQELFSEEVLRKFMALSQTFLVFFDNPHMQKERIPVHTDTLPGMYLSTKAPTLPLFHRKGELGIYWKMQDTDLWEMRVRDNSYPNYLHHTTLASLAPNPADNCIPHNTHRLSHAYFLKLSTSSLEFV